jgi:hypothetical protein
MASRYWVGGTAAWDGTAGTKWALTSGGAGGQAIPTSADDVFFDATSGANTVTISTGNTGAKSITCTGFTGTLAGTAAISVAGSVTLVAGQTVTYSGTLTLTATGTLTTAGKTVGPVTVTATASTVTLGGALTSSGVVTLTDGTLTTSASNYAITATQFVASGAGTKTLTLNGSTVTLSGNVTTVFNYSGSNMTLNAGTSTITMSGGGATFAGGGLTFNNVAFTSTLTTGGPKVVTGVNTFAQLTFTAPATGLTEFEFGANQTITTFVCAGASAVRRIMVSSGTRGTARTLTVGTYTTKTDVDFRDITAAGTSAPWSGTRLGDCKGCTSITFDAAKTVYWNLAGTQNWSATGWAATSGGAPAVNNFPLAQDTATFNDSGSAGTVTVESSWNIGTMTAASRTTSMTLSASLQFRIYGNWTSSSAVTNSSAGQIYFEGRTTQTFISAGGTFSFIASESASTISLGDALTTTGTAQGVVLLGGGTFNVNSYSYTGWSVSSSSTGSIGLGTGSFNLSGTGTVWQVFGSATVTGTGEIILTSTSTTARTFAGNGQTYGKLTIGGTTGTSTLTITGANTFTEIASTKTVAHTIVFPNATTTTGAFTVQGSAGNVVTLSRTGASGTFTLAKSGGGTVSSNYLSISNSTASPSTTWYAGANSTDGGGNTGWIFSNPPSGGNFLMFFM